MTVFCTLWPLKEKQNTWRGARNNLCYHGITTVGHEESLYQMCYSCTQQCSNYFDFLSLKLLILLPSAFHTCVREAKVLSLSVFCALVSMYGKCYKKNLLWWYRQYFGHGRKWNKTLIPKKSATVPTLLPVALLYYWMYGYYYLK